jgi:putative heme iron utilization protein
VLALVVEGEVADYRVAELNQWFDAILSPDADDSIVSSTDNHLPIAIDRHGCYLILMAEQELGVGQAVYGTMHAAVFVPREHHSAIAA